MGMMISLGSMACDVCGCRMGSAGLSGDYRLSSSVGIQYQQSLFRSLHENVFVPGEFSQSTEHYRTLGLSASYAFKDRWMVSISVPFAFNSYEFEGAEDHYSSLGDMAIFTTYRALKGSDEIDAIVDVTAGVKLPTGPSSNDFNYNIPSSSLPGTGSVDLRLGVRGLLATSEKWRTKLETSASINTRNPNGRKYGSQLQLEAGERYQWLNSETGLSSWVDLSYFFLADGDDSEILNGVEEIYPYSGHFHMASIGLIGQYGDFSLGAKVLIPFYQDFSEGLVEAATTVQIQVNYYFN